MKKFKISIVLYSYIFNKCDVYIIQYYHRTGDNLPPNTAKYVVFGGIWRYLAVFGGIWRYLAVFGGIWRYWAVLGGIGRYWAVLGGIGRYWAVLGGIGRYWAVLGGIGRYWAVLGGIKRYWAVYAVPTVITRLKKEPHDKPAGDICSLVKYHTQSSLKSSFILDAKLS